VTALAVLGILALTDADVSWVRSPPSASAPSRRSRHGARRVDGPRAAGTAAAAPAGDGAETSFETQRRLLDDVRHELKTPITIVRGHLEIMDPTTPPTPPRPGSSASPSSTA
jgi:signal transduction histidine kinase